MADAITSALRARPVATGVAAAAIVGVAWVANDYFSWKSFGTGGTPPTLAGYWRMTKLRVNALLHPVDLLDPSPLDATAPSFLKKPLPARGSRPKIMSRIMPQRQRPEPIEPQTRVRLQSLMGEIAAAHPGLLEIKLSHTEGRSTDGLYARKGVATLNKVAKDRILDHEIAHAHPAENSLHVWLSEADAIAVLKAGWGQRFPLTFVHRGWTMVYAPRNDEELEVVESIVKAGVAWITGVPI